MTLSSIFIAGFWTDLQYVGKMKCVSSKFKESLFTQNHSLTMFNYLLILLRILLILYAE